MTQTVNTERSTDNADSPQQRVDAWLASFESALKARDVEAAAALFATESYWRDLVSFTWNITTVEGRDGVSELLTGTLENTDPSGFATEEPPDEADGVVTAGSPSRPVWVGVAGCCDSRRRTARTAPGRC